MLIIITTKGAINDKPLDPFAVVIDGICARMFPVAQMPFGHPIPNYKYIKIKNTLQYKENDYVYKIPFIPSFKNYHHFVGRAAGICAVVDSVCGTYV